LAVLQVGKGEIATAKDVSAPLYLSTDSSKRDDVKFGLEKYCWNLWTGFITR
jgi:hypothetical protein